MQRILRITLIALLSVFTLLTVGLWGLTPFIAQRVLTDYFAGHNATFKAESLSLNPFTFAAGGRGVRVTTEQGLELEFDALDVQAQVLPLLENTVRVEKTILRGLNINITQQPGGWRVAGVFFPDTPVEQPAVEPQQPSPPWLVNLPSIQLRDCSVNLTRLPTEGNGEPLRDRIHIANLNISDIKGRGTDWSGQAELDARVNGADIVLSTQFEVGSNRFEQQMTITSLQVRLEQFSHYLPAPIHGSDTAMELAGEVTLAQTNGELTLTAAFPKLALTDIDLKLEGYLVAGETIRIDLNTLRVFIPETGPLALDVEGELQSSNISIGSVTGQSVLAGWERLDVVPVAFSLNNELELKIDQINSQNLVLSRSAQTTKQLPPLLQAGTLDVSRLAVTRLKTSIEQVTLNNIQSEVHLDQNRRLITLVQLESEGATTAETTTGETEAVTPSPHQVVIERVAITGDSRLNFTDEGINPAFKQNIVINSLTAEGLNTGDPQQALRVQLEAQTDKYSKITADTRLWPLADKLSLNTQAKVSEINLPPVSPYLHSALGYEIANGQLDMTLKMNIDRGRISGDSAIMLRGIDLGAPEAEQASLAKDSSAIPLNAAVGMLKDGKGNVELQMPLSGDVDNPSFGWSGFVALIAKKAVFEAASSYLMKTFVPYANVVSVVKFAGEQALKIRIAPLAYAPAQTEIGAEQQVFVEEFRKLLQDKEKLQVKTCPIATPAELGFGADSAKLTAEQLAALQTLAEQRGQAFKAKVLESGQLTSARILLCSPEIDRSKKGVPRIEFEI